ncbi:hypothetical protein Lfu02_02900 [Longispora fulva]|uniref:Uncharacterized protein n=1 Tax=Longispora fulva TaxID=619741 RepID=A0A8J7GPX9_9ACTN|nr:hypothetical protein [Longispora fulva]MBG6135838.1 hypothetical protein [Longispora fulva]GIG55918.1 hypothetical protein Lfu02_02900 [Longispora fulva]
MNSVDAFASSLSDAELNALGLRLDGGMSLHSLLRTWERCARVVSSGPIMVQEYINCLDIRNAIERDIELLTGDLAFKVSSLVVILDDVFRAATVDDGGLDVAQYTEVDKERGAHWWWTRKPAQQLRGW